MGAMWWQQTLWKIPPHFDGLHYWMEQEAEHAAIALQGALVRDIVLPYLAVFGPLVYLVELAIAVSLLLGLFARAGALLGLLMGLNLWLGLYSAPDEWPWTYMFLVMIQALVRDRSAGPGARRRRIAPPSGHRQSQRAGHLNWVG